MPDRIFIIIGSIFLFVSCVEYLTGYALHSTLFSSFTGEHTFVSKKNEADKWKTAIIFHIIAGIFFIVLDLLFG